MSSLAIPSAEIIDQFVGNAHGNFAVVKDLLEKYPTLVNTKATWNETAIQAATQTGQVDIVNYLIELGAEKDICTAAMLGDFDGVQECLEKDHYLIDARGAHGIPLLYFPVIHAHQHIADFLFQHGADPNAASPDGITPLYGAVMFNQAQLAHWLLVHRADPNPRYDGKTPLTIALEKNHSQLVDILRSFGGSE